MNDPIYTHARTNPNPTTIGEIIDWLQTQIDTKVVSRDTPIKMCEVALRIKEEVGVARSTHWLHIAAEPRTWDGEDLGTIFDQLDRALKKAVEVEKIKNTEFFIGFDGRESKGWKAEAGNPRPTVVPVEMIGGQITGSSRDTPEEALQSLIDMLKG